MSNNIRSLRGTKDTLPSETYKWQYVEHIAKEIAENYGFEEVRVPTIEKTDLFKRSVGETTDVVQKEMYTFEKGDESITLRPEGTAGTVRAFLQNGLLNEPFPVKLQYTLSCFRYERPQAGRLREFHQFGLECFGSESPMQDAEIIAMVDELLNNLGITGVELYINSIGCPNCRPRYNKELIAYYKQHESELCEDCKSRLEKNPLRLLDCKVESCQPIKKDAPRIIDYLCDDCEEHLDGLKKSLEALKIDYTINPDIVRGLDYYTRTVFEFVTTQIGAQGTICGGGRYDGLVEMMGGPHVPAIGFALGLERLLLVMEACGAPFPDRKESLIYIGSMGAEEARKALAIADYLRKEGVYVLCDTMQRSVRAQMKYADKNNSKYSCIIGGNELENNVVSIRNMKTGDSKDVKLNGESFLDFLWEKMHDDIISASSDIDGMMDILLNENE